MISQEEEWQLLIKLGLTALQAKVYLALGRLGKTTAKTISAQAQVDRADVYRVIATLQEQSLVEKVIANPLQFKAIPIQDGINILLERKHKENAEIQKQALTLLKQHQSQETKKETQEETIQFRLIPPKETHKRSLLNLLNNAQSMYAIVPREQIVRLTPIPDKYITKFLRQGGKHRLIISDAKNQEGISEQQKRFQNSKNNGSYQVRYTTKKLVAALAIFDEKKLWIDTLPAIQTDEQPNLFTNSPIIVELALRYFEREWKEAKST